jgi:hypothetical protein
VIAARPALDRLAGRRVTVAGANREAAYVEDDGFVAVLTTGRPLLPNGVQVARLPAVGDEVVVRGEPWDPSLRLPDDPIHIKEVGEAPEDLVIALRTRDPELAAAAGARLVGRGPGLTPEGDDLVAGVACVVAVGPWPRAMREAWVSGLIGGDLRRRTSSLSATLLELAAGGMGPEPLQALLAGEPGALERLLRLGHSTGRAYALGAAAGLETVAMRP